MKANLCYSSTSQLPNMNGGGGGQAGLFPFPPDAWGLGWPRPTPPHVGPSPIPPPSFPPPHYLQGAGPLSGRGQPCWSSPPPNFPSVLLPPPPGSRTRVGGGVRPAWPCPTLFHPLCPHHHSAGYLLSEYIFML